MTIIDKMNLTATQFNQNEVVLTRNRSDDTLPA